MNTRASTWGLGIALAVALLAPPSAWRQDEHGSIVGWGDGAYGQCSMPEPNTGFAAVAAGSYHSLGLKADGSIVARGAHYSGQCDVPAPNTDFVAVAAGGIHSLGLWGRPLLDDVDCDGDVDLADLSALLAVYGTTC